VFAARYGMERDGLRDEGRMGSAWWRAIVGIRDGAGGLRDGWFRDSVLRKVGDGSYNLFWSEAWLGGIPLYERFGRLFD
jgi:hypothetical protein